MKRPELWFCIRVGGVWQQVGSGFTLSTTAQNIRRTGNFAGVEAVALVTEAKNWGSNTHTLAGLNAFDATVDASVGDAYIVAPSAFGIFAGKDGQVAISEQADSFAFYPPQDGNKVFDTASGIEVQWRSATSAWISAAGVWVGASEVVSTAASGGADAGSVGYTYGVSTPPTTSNRRLYDGQTVTYRARKPGTKTLRFTYSADYQTLIGASALSWDLSWGLFRDSETSAIAWGKLPGYNPDTATQQGRAVITCMVDSPDTNEHVYTMALVGSETSGMLVNGTIVSAVRRREFYCEERG